MHITINSGNARRSAEFNPRNRDARDFVANKILKPVLFASHAEYKRARERGREALRNAANSK